ncbi:cyclin-dependent protein kinase regulatory subunit CKS1 [Aspergillus clavatus NRRL 1]|uniref:Cyclin-dependent kinases regulatory subunit n=1 Tax=Aspergillus clavatus (strain ATCC 1007 / CBS 513.65 / DSM 816 / NCTC 3887 / NRRL 1 / QM 1276 / 107) TaxID=344612 RepID=A1C3S9_ASPCL|nr:cyclin-dependent kinases regulatory subunit [Aspergillus clavatus NRRL 1]EAW15069.1 cyclin-dependent kinases regulatory subunit [Aspergillus clavatus NRRL 1]
MIRHCMDFWLTIKLALGFEFQRSISLIFSQMDIDTSRRNKKPRLLLESERERLEEFIDSIHYSARYSDDQFEYRHVQLPKNMLKKIPADYFDSSKGTLKLLWEDEWRALGITQSLGWEHYEVHEPEPHILLFK